MQSLKAGTLSAETHMTCEKHDSVHEDEQEQLSLFAQIPDPVTERLKNLDLMDTTPSQALKILEDIKKYL